MRVNPYNSVRYPTWPRLETHPDRLAAVAVLMGMTPAPVERCRVLEVGCGDGGNLLPMAYAIPDGRFTGVDTARAPVAEARRAIRALGLRNIEVGRADLRDLGARRDRFDYIVAHGVYSWVAEEVREGLLRVCRRLLAPNGVAMISYNVLPGGRMRQMLREMVLHRTGGADGAEGARRFLAFLREAAVVPEPWRGALKDEIDAALARDDAALVHDDLAPVNHAVYFHEFAAHARRHGLQYLGEAQVREMVDHGGALRGVALDRLQREQCLDFLKLRRFRHTLLCRNEVRLARRLLPSGAARLAFSSPARPVGDCLEGAGGVRIRSGNAAVDAVAEALRDAWPRPAPFAALRRHPGAREIVFALCGGGFAEPHAWVPPPCAAPGERPEASALARYEVGRGRFVTNLCHRSVEVDEATAALLPLLDGTRAPPALAAEWAAAAGIGARTARTHLPAMLEWLARMALLAPR